MRSTILLALLAALLPACGGTDAPKLTLSLGTAYDVLAVMRVMPDGGPAESLHEAYLSFEGLQLSGGRVAGTIGRRGAEGAAITGTFSAETGHLDVDQLQAALTSTISEHVDELGGRGDDLIPRDGVADELTGYLRTSRGTRIEDGTLLGVQRADARPAPVDEDKVEIREEGTSTVRVTGQAGTVSGKLGVEILRFRLAARTPDLVLIQARADGSFDQSVPGIREDVFVLRVRAVGMASDGRFFRVVR